MPREDEKLIAFECAFTWSKERGGEGDNFVPVTGSEILALIWKTLVYPHFNWMSERIEWQEVAFVFFLYVAREVSQWAGGSEKPRDFTHSERKRRGEGDVLHWQRHHWSKCWERGREKESKKAPRGGIKKQRQIVAWFTSWPLARNGFICTALKK